MMPTGRASPAVVSGSAPGAYRCVCERQKRSSTPEQYGFALRGLGAARESESVKAAASPGSARTPTYQLPARRLSDSVIVSPIGTVSVNWLAEWRAP